MIAEVALALALAASPPDDHWFGPDKLKHFFVAAFTQSVTYSALQASRARHDQALVAAWAVTAAMSVAKEAHDRRTTGLFSVRDLVWDAAGAGVATVLIGRAQRTAPSKAEQNPALDLATRLVQRPRETTRGWLATGGTPSGLSPVEPSPIFPVVAPRLYGRRATAFHINE